MQETYTFNLTQDEANMILAGLGELPAKASMNLINNLIQQFPNWVQQEFEGGIKTIRHRKQSTTKGKRHEGMSNLKDSYILQLPLSLLSFLNPQN